MNDRPLTSLDGHSDRPESCSGRANNVSVSARRHHLAPRLIVTLSGYQPAPFACRSSVGRYPTLSAHTRPVLGLTRMRPLDTYRASAPWATHILAIATPRTPCGISPRCRVMGVARRSYTEHQPLRTTRPSGRAIGGIEPPTGPLPGPRASRHCLRGIGISRLTTRAKTHLPAPARARALHQICQHYGRLIGRAWSRFLRLLPT